MKSIRSNSANTKSKASAGRVTRPSGSKKYVDNTTAFPEYSQISKHNIPETYLLSRPYLVYFTTYHPEDEEACYISAALLPERVAHSSQSRDEFWALVRPPLHRTNFYELYFIIQGSMFQNIENQRHLYPQGSCVILSRNVRRVIEYSNDFRCVSIQLSDDFIRDCLFAATYFQVEQNDIALSIRQFFAQDITSENAGARNYIDFIPLKEHDWILQNIHQLFERIVKETLEPRISSSHIVRALVVELLYNLFDSDNFSNTPVSLGNSGEKELFQEITKYIKERNGRVSRQELTEAFHYSGNYIYKVIHKYTGLSVFDYGMTFCLKEAARMLRETELTAQEIAGALGFSNRSHFYRLFKDMYGVTPREYRAHCEM